MSRVLALFDFDGTITFKDSLKDFIIYAVGKYEFYFSLVYLSPILVLYKIKIIPNHFAKRKLLSYHFKNWERDKLREVGKNYSRYRIEKIIRPAALRRLEWHKASGHEVVIVSASACLWLSEWCVINALELICTQLEYSDNKMTGRFSTKNCYGEEKVSRIREYFDLSEYQFIYAYGDSKGDKELLQMADRPFYKPFR